MKKLARLTALLLTGALLLVLTACGGATGAETEQQAKQRLLMEITSYRTTHDPILAPLVEVEQLSEAEQIWVEQFRTAGKTELPKSKTAETYEEWKSMTENRTRCSSYGWGLSQDASGELSDILFAKVPANPAELLATLNSHSAFKNSNCTSIGIAVVTIKGQMYWTCSVYY